MKNKLIYLFLVTILLNLSLGVSYAKEYRTPERIVSLTPTITEELYYLGVEDKIVGVTTYCLKPPQAQEKEKIGTVVKADIEKIVSLRPDIVISTTLVNPKTVNKLKSLGIRVVDFPAPGSFREICLQFLELGRIMAKEKEAEDIIARSQKTVDGIRDFTKHLDKKTVFVEIGESPLFTVTKDSFINDCIEYAGGINVAHDAGIGLYSREKLLKDNPDVIMIATMGVSGEKEKAGWQKFKTLKAVKNNSIFIIDSYKLCSPTPVSFVETLEEITKALHGRNEEGESE